MRSTQQDRDGSGNRHSWNTTSTRPGAWHCRWPVPGSGSQQRQLRWRYPACRAAWPSPRAVSSVSRIVTEQRTANIDIVEHVIQAVTAQEQAVSREQRQLEDIGSLLSKLRVRANGVGEPIAARVAPRCLGSDACPGRPRPRHERVVPRDLCQPIAAQQVGTAVTDIGDGRVLAVEQRRRQRRTHAGVRWFRLTGLEDRLVRPAVRLLQGVSQVALGQAGNASLSVFIAIWLATSPAGCPPMPSATTSKKSCGVGARANGEGRRNILVLFPPGGVGYRGDRQPERLRGSVNSYRFARSRSFMSLVVPRPRLMVARESGRILGPPGD